MRVDTQDKLIGVGIITALIAVIWFTVDIGDKSRARMVTAQEQRKEAVCPSFLSIARSSRDTLIVMRNEPLCNRYVLDNLK